MTSQSISSIARQVLGILGVVFGVLTQSVTALHLPVAVSSVLVVVGGTIVALEHYLSDPSTGSTNAPPPLIVTQPTATVPSPPVATPPAV